MPGICIIIIGSKLYLPSTALKRLDLMLAFSGFLPTKSISAVVLSSRNTVLFLSETRSSISKRNSMPEVISMKVKSFEVQFYNSSGSSTI